MRTQMDHRGALSKTAKTRRFAPAGSLLVLLLLLAACRRNPAETTITPTTELQDMASSTPLATTAPTATATPLPPTATAPPPTSTLEPSPTAADLPGRETYIVPYADPETDEDPMTLSRWLSVHRPLEGSGPYPTIFLLPGGDFEPTDYEDFAQELVDRGYAVVAVRYRSLEETKPGDPPSGTDMACAYAWTLANAEKHSLDPDRVYVFGHTLAGMWAVGASLEGQDDWSSMTADCPYPAPSPESIQGVITFDALLAMPEGTLGLYPVLYSYGMSLSGSEMTSAVAQLRQVSPADWSDSDALDDDARRLAQLLPLTSVYDAGSSGYGPPPYLLIYDTDLSAGFDFAKESELMAKHMEAVGIQVSVLELEGWDISLTSLLARYTGVPAQIADAIDAFIRARSQ